MSDDYSKRLENHQRDVLAGRFGKPSAGNPYSLSYQHGAKLGGRNPNTGQLLNNSSLPSAPASSSGLVSSSGLNGSNSPIAASSLGRESPVRKGIMLILFLPFVVIAVALLIAAIGSNVSVSRGGNYADTKSIPRDDEVKFSSICETSKYHRLETASGGNQKILAHVQSGTSVGVLEITPSSVPSGLNIERPIKVAVRKQDDIMSFFGDSYIVGYLNRDLIASCKAVPNFVAETAFQANGNISQSRKRVK